MTRVRTIPDRALRHHARRAAGQAAAVAGMIDADQPFEVVVQQLLATRGSLESLLVRLVERELADGRRRGIDQDTGDAHVLRVAFDRAHRTPGPAHAGATSDDTERTAS